jgi:hypothetical protein
VCFYGEEKVKRNIALIIFKRVLMLMRNIPDTCINVDENMMGPEMIFTHYLLHNINIDRNIVDP